MIAHQGWRPGVLTSVAISSSTCWKHTLLLLWSSRPRARCVSFHESLRFFKVSFKNRLDRSRWVLVARAHRGRLATGMELLGHADKLMSTTTLCHSMAVRVGCSVGCDVPRLPLAVDLHWPGLATVSLSLAFLLRCWLQTPHAGPQALVLCA